MGDLSKNQQISIENKFSKLNKLRPLPPSALRKLREHFRIEMTYNSNAIEGNSLTQKETFLVVNEGLTVKGKPLKDHLEATDHHAALEYLEDIVEHTKKATISEHLLKSLHQIITKTTEKEWAGKYRDSNVIIGGADHRPPEAITIPEHMKNLMSWLKENYKALHIVECAALFHHKLVHIHPFFDGNGRTARLAMNVLLMESGFPLVIILKNDRKKYYRVLAAADSGNLKPLVSFIAQAVERSLEIYLNSLTPASQKKEKYIRLSELAENSTYSAKYLNLLVREGKLEAHKEGRVWLSTKEALERYIEGRSRKR
jgi:Fic family protein